MAIKKVYLMRGVPGSGKSTYIGKIAKSLDDQAPVNIEVCSADHYFETCDCDTSHFRPGTWDHTNPQGYQNALADIRAYHVKYCIKPKTYKFDFAKLGAAHTACQDKFIKLLEDPDSMYIFVDNTNTTKRELDFYVKACVGHGVEFKIVNVICDATVAAKRNAHGVPEDKVLQMAARIKASAKDIPKDWPQEDYHTGYEYGA